MMFAVCLFNCWGSILFATWGHAPIIDFCFTPFPLLQIWKLLRFLPFNTVFMSYCTSLRISLTNLYCFLTVAGFQIFEKVSLSSAVRLCRGFSAWITTDWKPPSFPKRAYYYPSPTHTQLYTCLTHLGWLAGLPEEVATAQCNDKVDGWKVLSSPSIHPHKEQKD